MRLFFVVGEIKFKFLPISGRYRFLQKYSWLRFRESCLVNIRMFTFGLAVNTFQNTNILFIKQVG